MSAQVATKNPYADPIVGIVEVSQPGSLLRVWRIDLTEEAKRDLTVTREQWDAVSQPALPRPEQKP